jgi:hypothetical protein
MMTKALGATLGLYSRHADERYANVARCAKSGLENLLEEERWHEEWRQARSAPSEGLGDRIRSYAKHAPRVMKFAAAAALGAALFVSVPEYRPPQKAPVVHVQRAAAPAEDHGLTALDELAPLRTPAPVNTMRTTVRSPSIELVPDEYGPLPLKIQKSVERNDVHQSPCKDKVAILMYHMVDEQENRFTVSPVRLRKDLDHLRENGYGLRTFTEYMRGDCAPRTAVLTFDDSTEGQFRMLDGRIDPRSAIGVLEDYRKEYPGYRVTATMFVNLDREGKPPFEQPGLAKKKLEFLVKNDYEVGAHTVRHDDYAKFSNAAIRKDLREYKDGMHEYLPDYKVTSFAYPYGSLPSPEARRIIEQEYFTAHAWGGVARGQERDVPRIEIGPDSKLARYAPMLSPSEKFLLAGGNVYKGEQNHAQYGSHPQLQAQHPQIIGQPDDCDSGRSGLARESPGLRRQDSGLQHGQEGDQGRSALSARQQGSPESPLRDGHARTGHWPGRQDPIGVLLNTYSQIMYARKW